MQLVGAEVRARTSVHTYEGVQRLPTQLKPPPQLEEEQT